MRKRPALWLIVVAMLAICGAQAAGREKYAVAFLMSLDVGLDSQFKNIFDEVTPEISERLGVDLEFKIFNDESKFLDAVKKGEISIAYGLDPDVIIALVAKHGYIPFATYTMYGKKKMRMCIYTSKSGPYKSVRDLKGARVLISPKSLYFYMLLYKMAGESPMDFFHLNEGADPSSAVYAMSLGEADAILGSSQIHEYFKMTNPGPVKDAHEIACSDETYSMPFVRAKNMPVAVIEKLVEMMKDSHKDKTFKKFHPLMNMTKTRFIPVAPGDYAAELTMYEEAEKSGLLKEYRAWERLTLKKQDGAAPCEAGAIGTG